MSATVEVLLWAKRVLAKKTSPPHQLLGIAPDATVDQAQTAFHDLARKSHPDLYRNALTPEEHALVTDAYSMIAGAYQEFRSTRPTVPTRPTTGSAAIAATPSGPAPQSGVAGAMSSRALVYYRKAELALRRGELKGAVLQLKMAIAADPASAFLRTALAEVESELRKP
jgi:hypothetical protein